MAARTARSIAAYDGMVTKWPDFKFGTTSGSIIMRYSTNWCGRSDLMERQIDEQIIQ
jgi:hypothetical protein